jgi:hypothetical protein
MDGLTSDARAPYWWALWYALKNIVQSVAGGCTNPGKAELEAVEMVRRFGLLALTLFVLSAPAHSENGDELLQACESLERGARISGDQVQLPPRPDVHICWGYMSAVQDFSILRDPETKKTLFRSCPGPNTTLIQFIRIFTNYARTHPQQLHDKASLLVYQAMQSAFPCP